jgi:ABC-type uncharacterized transport system ATPase subunit
MLPLAVDLRGVRKSFGSVQAVRAGKTSTIDMILGLSRPDAGAEQVYGMAPRQDPGLLILDEPTQGMDVEGRRGFWTAIREDAARGQTIIFRTRARRCLHRPHRLNGRSPVQKALPLNATCPTARSDPRS